MQDDVYVYTCFLAMTTRWICICGDAWRWLRGFIVQITGEDICEFDGRERVFSYEMKVWLFMTI